MPKLILVPTPIGNLEDFTFRAIRILKEADVVLAEDTRVSAKLFKHYEISTRLESYHQHNEHKRTDGIVERIQGGEKIALITDAGTPAISDPGFLLVREAVKAGIEIETLPGATAFVPALVNSGLPCDRFYFEGFLPHKKGRQTRLEYLKNLDQTIVLYESPYRLVKTLKQLAETMGNNRLASVSRELSKLHEENKQGTLEELVAHFEQGTVKGEIVIIVGGQA
jgi:16S rRNA (cytidine1402-2'-O)-methyltransferase